jgi:hypothetical protein
MAHAEVVRCVPGWAPGGSLPQQSQPAKCFTFEQIFAMLDEAAA